MKNNFSKFAFTLAETLMVMAILGVTAALTVPNVMDSYKENQTIVKLIKVQEDLDKAYAFAKTTNGPFYSWPKFTQTADTSAYQVKSFVEYLKAAPCSSTQCGYLTTGTKYELNDGTLISIVPPQSSGASFNRFIFYVITDGGKQGRALAGVNYFGFYLDIDGQAVNNATCATPIDKVYPMGLCSDKGDNNAFSGSGLSTTNWAIFNKNLDFNKCSSSLVWGGKTTCK